MAKSSCEFSARSSPYLTACLLAAHLLRANQAFNIPRLLARLSPVILRFARWHEGALWLETRGAGATSGLPERPMERSPLSTLSIKMTGIKLMSWLGLPMEASSFVRAATLKTSAKTPTWLESPQPDSNLVCGYGRRRPRNWPRGTRQLFLRSVSSAFLLAVADLTSKRCEK